MNPFVILNGSLTFTDDAIDGADRLETALAKVAALKAELIKLRDKRPLEETAEKALTDSLGYLEDMASDLRGARNAIDDAFADAPEGGHRPGPQWRDESYYDE